MKRSRITKRSSVISNRNNSLNCSDPKLIWHERFFSGRKLFAVLLAGLSLFLAGLIGRDITGYSISAYQVGGINMGALSVLVLFILSLVLFTYSPGKNDKERSYYEEFAKKEIPESYSKGRKLEKKINSILSAKFKDSGLGAHYIVPKVGGGPRGYTTIPADIKVENDWIDLAITKKGKSGLLRKLTGQKPQDVKVISLAIPLGDYLCDNSYFDISDPHYVDLGVELSKEIIADVRNQTRKGMNFVLRESFTSSSAKYLGLINKYTKYTPEYVKANKK
ncbi:MAG: hypothetical protein V1660_01925 [archaeon]